MKKLVLALVFLSACASAPQDPDDAPWPEFFERNSIPKGTEAHDWGCVTNYYSKKGIQSPGENMYPAACLQAEGTYATKAANDELQDCFEKKFVDERMSEIDAKIYCEAEMRRVYFNVQRRLREKGY